MSLWAIGFLTYNVSQIDLKPNKGHGHNMVSVPMLKIWDESICKPLGIIFRSHVQNGNFCSESQCGSYLQKNNEEKLKKHHPISLLLVSGKIFGRLLYGSMFLSFASRIA